MRLAVWSPLPPSGSGIADYVAEQLPALAAQAEVTAVVEDPALVDPGLPATVRVCAAGDVDADLHMYHLGNSPAHAYVYRAACARPGVAVLHDWSLHHLVLCETVERGDRASYLREMRRSYGEAGSFVGRQVARALGGSLLPARFPLNERVLDGSLAVVGLSSAVCEGARRRMGAGRPVLHLPHHVALPLSPLPDRREARRALGLPEDALVLTAPGLATAAKRMDLALGACGRLAARFPRLELVVAGATDPDLPLVEWAAAAGLSSRLRITGRLTLPDFVRHLCAADVVLGLRFPSHGEMSGALLRALGVGRPVLVSGGSTAAEDLPDGVVVVVPPGRAEEQHLEAALEALLADPSLREQIGGLARRHVRGAHDLAATTGMLARFLEEVGARRAVLLATVEGRRAAEGSLLQLFYDEARWAALDLGLAGGPPGVEPLLRELCEGRA